MDEGGLDAFLQLFKLPIKPINYNNDFHSVLACFKALPSNQGGIVMNRVINELSQSIERLQEISGSFNEINDFSTVVDRDSLIITLASIDSFIEMLKLLISNGLTPDIDINQFCGILSRLG